MGKPGTHAAPAAVPSDSHERWGSVRRTSGSASVSPLALIAGLGIGIALWGALPALDGLGEPHRGPGTAASPPHFTRVTSGAPATDAWSSPSASWIDIDADGDEDLYVLNGFGSLEENPRPQPNALYLNDGAGAFSPVTDHPLVEDVTFSGSATWGDYDNDGDPDLFVANQRGADNLLFRNDGRGAFVRLTDGPAASDGGRSFSAAWVDGDGDGLLDLHVLNGRDGDDGEADFFYRNLGGGALERLADLPFTREALRSGGGAWADFDGDGDPDLLLPVHEAGRGPRLYRNEGGLRFTEVAAEAGLEPDPLPLWPAFSVALWVDYDDDGDLDLFLGTTGGAIDYLFANGGEGRFERAVAGRVGLDATYVSDALWADLENDGDQDLVLAVWGGASEIYLNDGKGRLHPTEAGEFGEIVTFASSVSASDIDGDGDLDLYLTQWPIDEAGGAPNLLYRNDGPAGHWLAIDLEGTESNRSAVGALVTVTAEIGGETRRQFRQVASRTSWRSANSLAQRFGLGDADHADRIEVAWPSGRVDTLDGPIPANRRLRIAEGRDRDAPDARAHHELVYHAGEERVYLIGGSTRRGDAYHYFDDVWVWDGSDWARSARLPFPRSSHRTVYHARRRSLALFGGGHGRGLRADGVLWERRDGEWKAVGGHPRAGTDEPGMCYDRGRRRVVLFGGWDAAAAYRDETWEWTGAELVQVDSTGPSPRAGHAFLFDPVRRRCLLFGGRGANGYLADTWEWDGARWHRLEAAGPSARWFFGSAADPDGGRIVIFGGGGPDAETPGRGGAGNLGDTWAWDGTRWELVTTDGPSPRSMAKMAFDGRGVLLFGGRVETPEGFEDRNDTWELRGRSWTLRR